MGMVTVTEQKRWLRCITRKYSKTERDRQDLAISLAKIKQDELFTEMVYLSGLGKLDLTFCERYTIFLKVLGRSIRNFFNDKIVNSTMLFQKMILKPWASKGNDNQSVVFKAMGDLKNDQKSI